MIEHVDLNNAKHSEVFSSLLIDHLNGLDRFPREHAKCYTCMLIKDLHLAGTLDAIIRLSYFGRYDQAVWWEASDDRGGGSVDMKWVNGRRLDGALEVSGV